MFQWLINNICMKRENQFSNPELSLQLKSQGIKQDSLYYWWFPLAEENYRKANGSVPIGYSEEPILMTWNVSQDFEHFSNHYKEGCSAFSVAELGEMFPRSICDNDTTGRDEEYHFLQVHTVGGGVCGISDVAIGCLVRLITKKLALATSAQVTRPRMINPSVRVMPTRPCRSDRVSGIRSMIIRPNSKPRGPGESGAESNAKIPPIASTASIAGQCRMR